MTILILGLILFFTAHVYSLFRSRAPGHDTRQRLGEGLYMGLYSIVSLAGFGLIIWGYNSAPGSEALYFIPIESRWISAALLLAALICIVSAYVPAGRIKRTLKHPMMVGIGLWALAHLLYGGDMVPVLLFGSFFLYAVLALIAYVKRPTPQFSGPPSTVGDVIAVVFGTGLFVGFVYGLHLWLIGIQPILPF